MFHASRMLVCFRDTVYVEEIRTFNDESSPVFDKKIAFVATERSKRVQLRFHTVR